MRIVDQGTGRTRDGDLVRMVEAVRDDFGFEHVAYAGRSPTAGMITGHVTYPEAWKAHYVSEGLHLRDPTLLMSARSVAPVDWSRLAPLPSARAIFERARDFGIAGPGLTVPVRGPYGDVGLLSVTGRARDWESHVAGAITALQSRAVFIHDAHTKTDPLFGTLNPDTLTARERDVLQWTAAGRSQRDVGEILAISARTVEIHLAAARRKLNALTTAQAVGRAIALGIVHPQ